jgi:hypothetical protein
MVRTRTAVLYGTLFVLPLAVVAWVYGDRFLDPSQADPGGLGALARALGLGPLRGLAFAAGAIGAALVLATAIAREETGPLAGFVEYVVLAPLIAAALAGLELVARGAAPDPIAWTIGLAGIVLCSAIAWIPIGGIWVSLVRRRLVPGVAATSDLERAEGQRRLNEAARDHVIVDATNLANQGSGNLRNRG